jgi:hypothetical protein
MTCRHFTPSRVASFMEARGHASERRLQGLQEHKEFPCFQNLFPCYAIGDSLFFRTFLLCDFI